MVDETDLLGSSELLYFYAHKDLSFLFNFFSLPSCLKPWSNGLIHSYKYLQVELAQRLALGGQTDFSC